MFFTIIFLPLLNFFCAGMLGRFIDHRGASLVSTILIFINTFLCFFLWKKISLGDQKYSLFVDWGFFCNKLLVVILLSVKIVLFWLDKITTCALLFELRYTAMENARQRLTSARKKMLTDYNLGFRVVEKKG